MRRQEFPLLWSPHRKTQVYPGPPHIFNAAGQYRVNHPAVERGIPLNLPLPMVSGRSGVIGAAPQS